MNLKKVIRPFLNIKFLISFGLAWMITNGWCYVFIWLGTWLDIRWMFIVGSTYLAFLWMPFTIEKVITIPLAIFFQTKLFPHDKKLAKQLQEMSAELKGELARIREDRHWRKMHRYIDKGIKTRLLF